MLLILFLLAELVLIVIHLFSRNKCVGDDFNRCDSFQFKVATIRLYAAVCTTLLEFITFFLVVSLMLPVTEAAIRKREEFVELLKNQNKDSEQEEQVTANLHDYSE